MKVWRRIQAYAGEEMNRKINSKKGAVSFLQALKGITGFEGEDMLKNIPTFFTSHLQLSRSNSLTENVSAVKMFLRNGASRWENCDRKSTAGSICKGIN